MIFERVSFDDARDGLDRTFNGMEDDTRANVESGKAEVWKCELGFFITECLTAQSEVFIWCFQGRGALRLWVALARAVKPLGFTHLGCFTRHKAAVWLFRKYKPEISCNDGEYRIRVAISELLNYVPTGSISSAPHQESASQGRRRAAECDSRNVAL